MSTQHTPGPWGLNPDWIGDDLAGHIPVSSKAGKGGHLALAQVVWIMEDDEHMGRNSPECEANARLIAAAPELLAQLEIARDRINDILSNDDGQAFKEAAKWMPGIEAAITKATGGAA